MATQHVATPAGTTQSAAQQAEQSSKQTRPSTSSTDSFRLPHHVVERTLRIKPPERRNRKRKRKNHGFGIVVVNILVSVASYATDATMQCYPSVPTVARDTGYSERLVSYVLAQFEKVGIFERKERWKQSTVYTWIRSDAQSGYTIVNRKWWEGNADLGEGRGLFVQLHALADGKPLTINLTTESSSRLGTSRTKVYGLLPALKAKDMVETMPLRGGATEVQVRVSQSQRAQVITEQSQRAQVQSQRAHEQSQWAQVINPNGRRQRKISTRAEGFDFEVQAHKIEDSARKNGERPVANSPGFQEPEPEPVEVEAVPVPNMTPTQLREMYRGTYREAIGAACPWDGGDDAACARTIGHLPDWGRRELETCVANLFLSRDGACTRKPSAALREIGRYIAGPFNRYNRPLTEKDLSISERLRAANYGADAVFTNVASDEREEVAPEAVKQAEAERQEKVKAAAQEMERQARKAEAEREKRRRKQLEQEIVEDEELVMWEKWDGIGAGDERWSETDAVRDRALVREKASWAALSCLEEEAVATPQFQRELTLRLAEPEEARKRRRDERARLRREHGERRRAWKRTEQSGRKIAMYKRLLARDLLPCERAAIEAQLAGCVRRRPVSDHGATPQLQWRAA
jgi:hypothetical protein